MASRKEETSKRCGSNRGRRWAHRHRAGPRRALVVVEAKRGWRLPTIRQLETYSKRVVAAGGGLLIRLSDASPAWAAHVLPGGVDGVRSAPGPGRGARRYPRRSIGCPGFRTSLAGGTAAYLRKVVHVHDPASRWGYCVVVSDAKPDWGDERTYREYVTEADTYFHPLGWGKGWPTEPPNFMAFRHRGKVIRVSRVVDAEVVPTITDRWARIEPIGDAARPHAVYALRPALPLPAPVPSARTTGPRACRCRRRAARLRHAQRRRRTVPPDHSVDLIGSDQSLA